MSSLTEPAPVDPADLTWMKIGTHVLEEAIDILKRTQEALAEPALIREIAYLRHRLELVSQGTVRPIRLAAE